MTSAEELRQLAVSIAIEAGTSALRMRSSAVAGQVSTKASTTDLVTSADRAAEQLIVRRLIESRPTDALVGEEGAAEAGESDITWYVDPIDGTTNFVYGLDGWSVSIAAWDGEGPLAAAVYDPTHETLWEAARGGGALRNGRPLETAEAPDMAEALLATGFSYRSDQRGRQAAILTDVLPRVRDIRRFGSAAIDLCRVGDGTVDAYYEAGLNSWDMAAGWLVASEAGATVQLLGDSSAPRRTLLAARPPLFDALFTLLDSAGAIDDP